MRRLSLSGATAEATLADLKNISENTTLTPEVRTEARVRVQALKTANDRGVDWNELMTQLDAHADWIHKL